MQAADRGVGLVGPFTFRYAFMMAACGPFGCCMAAVPKAEPSWYQEVAGVVLQAGLRPAHVQSQSQRGQLSARHRAQDVHHDIATFGPARVMGRWLRGRGNGRGTAPARRQPSNEDQGQRGE